MKTQKTTSLASVWWVNTKSSFKENARTFSESSATQENIRISKPKKRLRNLYEKKISNQKSNQWLKNCKMKFINTKTNKQKVLNFVLTLGRSWRAKKAPKVSSEYFEDRICKFKQYLNYILMIINQNILRTFLNLQKSSKAATTEFLSKHKENI